VAFTVRLRWPLIDDRVAAKGGTMAVTERAGLNRSTISRWRKQSALPNDPLQFLRLAQVLEIDPLLLFELDEQRFSALCFQVGKLLLSGGLAGALRSLAFVEEFWTCAGESWPPATVVSRSGTVGYDWHTADFVHEGQLGVGPKGRNFYASIPLDGSRIRSRNAPQVWHLAYRDRVGAAALWHPYGSVAMVGDRIELYAYQGRVEVVTASGPFAIQTWFGEGDAEFRIASLHPFRADVMRDAPPDHAVVRFSLPRRLDGVLRPVASGG